MSKQAYDSVLMIHLRSDSSFRAGGRVGQSQRHRQWPYSNTIHINNGNYENLILLFPARSSAAPNDLT